MITTPEDTIKSSEEQIQVLRSRLISLNADITVHNTTLRAIQDEIIQSTKQKNNLSEQATNLQNSVDALTKEKELLRSAIKESTTTLETSRVENENLKNEHKATQGRLTSWEANLNDKQAQLNLQSEELGKQLTQIAQDKALVDKKHSILSQAVKAFGDTAA